jgi:hypothetical protein
MHGFLNVWVAGLAVCSKSENMDSAKVATLLEDEDATNFHFDDRGITWRDVTVPTEVIAAARCQMSSFGSCSFDEPRDDLRAMGLLP